MSATETLSVADRMALTLDGLGQAVAARILGGAMQAVMILLVWRRLRRIEGQIRGLLARFRAGRLWVRRVSPGGVRGAHGGSGPALLPRGFGWLLALVPQEAACFAGQMRGVLAEPEMVALLAAAPQARRVLAPLCRMLGIETAVLVSAEVASGAPASLPAADGGIAELACATSPPSTRLASSSDPPGRSSAEVGKPLS